ncbi:MAG: hypothetical protein IKP41_06000 [Bacteroidaceae bacterium]|nr:hypothetical protein [Bacteroidaceae bacterium]
MRRLHLFLIAMMLMAVVDVHAQKYTKSTVKGITNAFISTLMQGELKNTLEFFDPNYVAEQHDNFLEGRTEQFVAEFLCGSYKKGFYDITPQLHRIKSMKVKKTCCDLEKNEIYADVKILMDYGVKYTVRLDMLITESGDLRFIGAVG